MSGDMGMQKENQRQTIERLLMAVSKGLDLIKARAIKTNNRIIGPRPPAESEDKEKREARAGFLGGIIDTLEIFRSKTREIDGIQRDLERETGEKRSSQDIEKETLEKIDRL